MFPAYLTLQLHHLHYCWNELLEATYIEYVVALADKLHVALAPVSLVTTHNNLAEVCLET